MSLHHPSIWKFPLLIDQMVSMPRGARVLSVGAQGDEIMVWAVVDPRAPRVDRLFPVFGTGHPMDPGYLTADHAFVGTAQMDNGLVFHVFDLGEPELEGAAG